MTREVVGLVLFDYRLGVDSRRGLDAEALLNQLRDIEEQYLELGSSAEYERMWRFLKAMLSEELKH